MAKDTTVLKVGAKGLAQKGENLKQRRDHGSYFGLDSVLLACVVLEIIFHYQLPEIHLIIQLITPLLCYLERQSNRQLHSPEYQS